MQRQRGELVPIGDALSDMGGPVQALRETPPPARRGFTVADQVDQLGDGQRSGRRPRVHGANDGTVFVAPHQPRQPAPVQAGQRSLHARHDRRGQQQAPLR